ncbi:MAG: hypothetical protein K0S04_3472 [Herbinix sp.]|nr:hypothetical protein [Herbinix sp.]
MTDKIPDKMLGVPWSRTGITENEGSKSLRK